MLLHPERYFCWKGDTDTARVQQMQADLDAGYILARQILDIFKISQNALETMFDKNVGPDYDQPGQEMVTPKDLSSIDLKQYLPVPVEEEGAVEEGAVKEPVKVVPKKRKT
jgi:hypothetical protein